MTLKLPEQIKLAIENTLKEEHERAEVGTHLEGSQKDYSTIMWWQNGVPSLSKD
ncbi:MAG: hypothetical protein IH951_12265 [Bacteroidetes bacterium]|nr:hypothetical protein [Bacteroidota bacterium]